MKNKLYRTAFSFFYDVIFGGWIGLENWQIFLKNHVFSVTRVHKNDPLVLRRIVGSANFNICTNF